MHLPNTLASIQHSRVFQFDLHSHPGEEALAYVPSIEDGSFLDSTVDGKLHISAKAGLVELSLPQSLPGGFKNLYEIHQAWALWITEDLKLNEAGFERIDGLVLMNQFFRTFFTLRIIPWQNSSEIETLLDN